MAQRSEPAVQTFLFADLSGFTALTEAHGDEQAAALGVALLPAAATGRYRR
jgi:class 3 adenylate cyclase